MPTPRPHYKERIAHAEGYEIECFDEMSGKWVAIHDPQWYSGDKYRVKPEPKPDVVSELLFDHYCGVVPGKVKPNLRLTFDGETGQLKSAEVIKP